MMFGASSFSSVSIASIGITGIAVALALPPIDSAQPQLISGGGPGATLSLSEYRKLFSPASASAAAPQPVGARTLAGSRLRRQREEETLLLCALVD